MGKPKIIHFIFDLARGGAETMMVRVIKELTEYENVVVTLFPLNRFGPELKCDKFICFNLTSLFQLPLAIIKLRKVIRNEKPQLVHTHLFWPTIIARMAVPRRIPLVTTIHAFIASSVEYKNFHVRVLDKITYRFRKTSIIAVAKNALTEYFTILKLKPYKAHTLYTFVDTAIFNTAHLAPQTASSPVFKVISVGALRKQKNYGYLIEAFAKVKDQPFELHIYGEGDIKEQLEQKVKETGAKVVFKGMVKNIEKIIPEYDLFSMSSTYEGFSLSVLEAMAMQVPLLLSDMPSFREQCDDTCLFFDLDNTEDYKNKIQLLFKDKALRQTLAAKAKQRVLDNFTLQHHMQQLRSIYSSTIIKNN
jgi:glycosyltransferase involved in cell wall biosynthesis